MDDQELAELAAAHRERSLAPGAEHDSERLGGRADELGAVLLRVLEAGDRELALRGAGGLSVFWQDAGLVALGRSVTEAVLAAAGDATSVGYARAALVAGELAFRQGDQDTATAWSQVARSVGGGLDDGWVAARAEINLARIALRDGDAARIEGHADAALPLSPDDPSVQASAHHMLGWAAYTAGDVVRAIAMFEENADRYRTMGDEVGEASELANVAELCMEVGELERAAPLLARALRLPHAATSSYLAPSLVRAVGLQAGLTGDLESAAELLAGAEALYESFGLTPDPGDELTPQVIDIVGHERLAAARTAVAGQPLDQLVERALRSLKS